MSQTFIRYYAFQQVIPHISTSITSNQELDYHALFKYALFADASLFYGIDHPFKVDHYQVSKRIFQDKFDEFFLECIENAYFHSSTEEMLFCYFILYSHIITTYMNPYIKMFMTKKKSKSYIEKMLESYFFMKKEGKPITKINLRDYFFDAFGLSYSDISLIDRPVKRVLGFFKSKNYYDYCYKNAATYYDHFCRSKFGFKKIIYFVYDTLLNHRKGRIKAKNYIYHKKIDTTILNLSHQEFQALDKTYKDNIDEYLERIIKALKSATLTLNDYFNYNQNKKSIDNLLKQFKPL